MIMLYYHVSKEYGGVKMKKKNLGVLIVCMLVLSFLLSGCININFGEDRMISETTKPEESASSSESAAETPPESGESEPIMSEEESEKEEAGEPEPIMSEEEREKEEAETEEKNSEFIDSIAEEPPMRSLIITDYLRTINFHALFEAISGISETDQDQASSEKSRQKFFNLEVGKTISPTVEDASIPMINRLGCGYDVFGNTATNFYVREPVLDLRRLLADGMVQATRLDHAYTRETVSESIKEYAKKITNQASVKGGYLCFKGSVNMNFTNEQQREESNYFATYERILQKYRTYILGRTDLKKYIIPEVAADLANRDRSVEDLFKTYGHYVIINSIVGGKVVYNCTSSSTKLSNFDAFQIEARASCDLVFANVGTSYGNQTTKETSQFNSRKQSSFYSDGGEYSLSESGLKDVNFIRDWEKTLESKGALIDFDENVNCLVPLWELCPDEARAEELKKAFEAMSKSYEHELPDQKHQYHRYLSLLRLGVQGDAQEARAEATGGSATLIDTDLNVGAGGDYIYLARQNGMPGSWSDAITDILISTKHEGQTHQFNHNGQKDNYRLLIKANEYWGGTSYHAKYCDLNYRAGGDYLWLYYTKALGINKSPIYDIMVYDAGSKKAKGYENCLNEAIEKAEQDGWEIVCFAHSTTPADLNHNAGGNALFLFIKRDTRITAS